MRCIQLYVFEPSGWSITQQPDGSWIARFGDPSYLCVQGVFATLIGAIAGAWEVEALWENGEQLSTYWEWRKYEDSY